MADYRYFLTYHLGEEREVTKDEYVRAERAVGFHNTLGQPHEPATSSFGGASVRGRTVYVPAGETTPEEKTA